MNMESLVETAETVHDGVERRLDPRYVTLERIAGWIRATIFGGVTFFAALIAILVVRPGALALGVLVGGWALFTLGLAVLAHAWPSASYRRYAYRIDDRGLEIRRGVVWREVIHVPRSRVQHTDVVQGPLQRQFGLSTLVVFTAGTHHASVHLPGLERARAVGIRDFLVAGGGPDAV